MTARSTPLVRTKIAAAALASMVLAGAASIAIGTTQPENQPENNGGAKPNASEPNASKKATAGQDNDDKSSLSADSLDRITAQFRRHGLAAAPAKPRGAVRLATYNIHELFDDRDDPALTGRLEDIGRVMIETRQAATALALRKIDADIVALQEVESLDAVNWYRDANLADQGYRYTASEDVGHSLGLEQAVLSRFPIIATQTWPDRVIGEHPELYRGKPNRYAGQPLTFRRSPLMVELALVEGTEGSALDSTDANAFASLPEADRLTLLVVHFKTGEGSKDWRAAEGKAVAAIAAELKANRPDRRMIVLGDFATDASEGHTTPLSEAGFTDAFGDASADHNAIATSIATSIEGERACRVLLGKGVAQAPGSTPFVLGTVAPPERIDRRMGFRMPGFASDHYPVVVDLEADLESRVGAGEGSGGGPDSESSARTRKPRHD